MERLRQRVRVASLHFNDLGQTDVHILVTISSVTRNWTNEQCEKRIGDMLRPLNSNQIYEMLKIQDTTSGRYTALHYAAMSKDSDFCLYILDYLSPDQQLELLKIQDAEGNTPLHSAAYANRSDFTQAMLNYLNPKEKLELLEITNDQLQTASDQAAQMDHSNVVDLLEYEKTSAKQERIRRAENSKNLRPGELSRRRPVPVLDVDFTTKGSAKMFSLSATVLLVVIILAVGRLNGVVLRRRSQVSTRMSVKEQLFKLGNDGNVSLTTSSGASFLRRHLRVDDASVMQLTRTTTTNQCESNLEDKLKCEDFCTEERSRHPRIFTLTPCPLYRMATRNCAELLEEKDVPSISIEEKKVKCEDLCEEYTDGRGQSDTPSDSKPLNLDHSAEDEEHPANDEF